MGDIVSLDELKWYRDEVRLEKAAADAAAASGEPGHVPCPNGDHTFEFLVKRIGERGDAKVQYHCEWCGLGGEGYFPAGGWANK